MRLFFAVELPTEVRAYCASLRERFPTEAPFRWVAPHLMHITLAFLGEQPESALPTLETAAIDSARGQPSFAIRLGPLETFGPRAAPSTLVVQLADNADLRQLQARLSDALRARSLPFEDRPYRPHVTLARARTNRPDRAAPPFSPPAIPVWEQPVPVSRFVLIHSVLGTSGPTYTPLKSFPLGSAALPDPGVS